MKQKVVPIEVPNINTSPMSTVHSLPSTHTLASIHSLPSTHTLPSTHPAFIFDAWRFVERIPLITNKFLIKVFGDWRLHLFLYNKCTQTWKQIKSKFIIDYSSITSVTKPIPPETAIDIDFTLYWIGSTNERIGGKNSWRKLKCVYNLLVFTFFILAAIKWFTYLLIGHENKRLLMVLGDFTA